MKAKKKELLKTYTVGKCVICDEPIIQDQWAYGGPPMMEKTCDCSAEDCEVYKEEFVKFE